MSQNKILTSVKDVEDSIDQYNRFCLHYDLVAKAIYKKRDEIVDPFNLEFQPYIVAGLIAFDMRRGGMMGKDVSRQYDPQRRGFAAKLKAQLNDLAKILAPLINSSLIEMNLETKQTKDAITQAYNCLTKLGEDKKFHVGATKILHWLAPELFIIVDTNIKQAFPSGSGLKTGYTAKKYFDRLVFAKDEILCYGSDKLRSHEPKTPLARLFDKVAFVAGGGLENKKSG